MLVFREIRILHIKRMPSDMPITLRTLQIQLLFVTAYKSVKTLKQ